jgi:hypothetical protein
MAGDGETWIWAGDPENLDREWIAFFEDFFDRAIKDADGFYSEQLPVGIDGRLSPDKRADGSLSLLPACFHQIRLRAHREGEIATRGPTVEEFYRLLAKLQELMPTFEFVIQEDPQRRWVRYRARH